MEFIVFVLSVGIVALLFHGAILVLVSKFFKVENLSYRKSLIILVACAIVSFAVGAVFYVLNFGFLANVLASVAVFFMFHFFYKKYYLSSWKRSLGIYVTFLGISFIISVLVVIPTRLFLFSPFFVSGDAMSPTYNDGDYLLATKFGRSFSRGEVIVFEREGYAGASLIKRVVGLPGEKVDVRNGKVFINDQVLNEGYVSGETTGTFSVALDHDQYFVLGDNRGKSLDSRSFGPIAGSSIEGKAFLAFPSL